MTEDPEVKEMTHGMTEAELLALPVSVDLATAGRALGIGRTKAFELARAGQFPCKVLQVGQKYRVPRTAILAALDVKPPAVPAEAPRPAPLAFPAHPRRSPPPPPPPPTPPSPPPPPPP